MAKILPSKKPYEHYIVYGPSLSKSESRRVVVLVDKETKKKTSTSYARYLMSTHIGRMLTKEEKVDHINNDKLDDRIENFQILTHSENLRKSTNGQKFVQYPCARCGAIKTVRKGLDYGYLKRGYAYCSRICSYKKK